MAIDVEQRKERNRLWDQTHRKQRSEAAKARRIAYPETTKLIRRRTAYKTRYGITIEQYDAMLEAQNGGCAICGRTPEESVRRLAIDHNHGCCPGNTSCGLCVVAILCGPCNTGIGLFNDDAQLMHRAVTYLTQSRGTPWQSM